MPRLALCRVQRIFFQKGVRYGMANAMRIGRCYNGCSKSGKPFKGV